MTYKTKSRAETNKARPLKAAKMSTMCTNIGKTRLDRIRKKDIRQQCNINDIV